ncbi:Glycosyl hydrolase family protein with chitinase insertion domain [Striga hermonthica]|uniref:Glycosyl hydrolase family protein with chitinase insertion domain n=1 Tax=Striga hermonthica TaxID=68872 RepID=A0A9N7MHB8_STRHE|nr:Glycosyl hydrolase family protein with chitinase insertion domain [Striga hermonthica]
MGTADTLISTTTLHFLLLLCASSLSNSQPLQPVVVKAGYYPSWARNMGPNEIDTTYYTHIFYAFVVPNNLTFTFDNIGPQQKASLRNFTSALRAKNPPVGPLFSIGGGGADPTLFSRMGSAPSTRKAFIDSAISLARDYGFCGMDLDYEFPRNASDMDNLGLLLREWRKAVERESKRTGKPRLLITAAVYYAADMTLSGAPRSYPARAIQESLDWVNMMDYDYHGSWEPSVTGAHAQLYDPSGRNLSTSYGVESWMKAGVAARKLVMGLPMYGRTWKLESANQTGIGAPAVGVGLGDEGTMTYGQIVNLNATEVYDSKTVSAYSVSGLNWIGYDNVRAVAVKVNFANKLKLRGHFFWAVNGDYHWRLSKAVSEAWISRDNIGQ